MTTEEKEQLHALLIKAVEELSEHFDSVRIFCTLHCGNDNGTLALTRGAGNTYAILGQMIEWMETDKTRTNLNVKPDE